MSCSFATNYTAAWFRIYSIPITRSRIRSSSSRIQLFVVVLVTMVEWQFIGNSTVVIIVIDGGSTSVIVGIVVVVDSGRFNRQWWRRRK